MTKSPHAIPWLQNKYGEHIQVFEGNLLLSNNELKLDGKTKTAAPVQYQYILNRQGKKRPIVERTNNLRTLLLQKVADYTGLLEQRE